jgi:hypothetical protein
MYIYISINMSTASSGAIKFKIRHMPKEKQAELAQEKQEKQEAEREATRLREEAAAREREITDRAIADDLLLRKKGFVARSKSPRPIRQPSKLSILNPVYRDVFLPEEYWQEPSDELSTTCRPDATRKERDEYTATFNDELDKAFKNEQSKTKNVSLYTIKLNLLLEDFVFKTDGESTYYARCFDFPHGRLTDIKRFIKRHIKKWVIHPTKVCLIVDLENAYQKILNEFSFKHSEYNLIMKELCYILCTFAKEQNIGGIVLCIQNHHCSIPGFFTFLENLQRCVGIEIPILILPGHNRASVDDILVMMTALILTYLKKRLLIFTNDKYNDILTHPSIKANQFDSYPYIEFIKRFRPSTTNSSFHYDFNLGEPIPTGPGDYLSSSHGGPSRGGPSHDGPSRDGSSRGGPRSYSPSSHGPPRSERSRSPRHRGGTIKYKKSLLNKRTRKIYKKNYSQKMKKYSKNKKNKTLRRKRAP